MAPDVGSSVRPMTPRPCMEGVRNEWAVTFETLHCNVEFRIPSKVLCRVGQPGTSSTAMASTARRNTSTQRGI
jgi:hypothetical protein